MALIVWFASGIFAWMFAYWVTWLTFRPIKLTLGTILLCVVGCTLPPITALFGLVGLFCWAVSPLQLQGGVRWPLWWERMRYRQHRTLRKVYYLGHPPTHEDLLSSWNDYKFRDPSLRKR